MDARGQFRIGRSSLRFHHHRFSFGDCCIALEEFAPDPAILDLESGTRQVLFFLHGRYGHSETWLPIAETLGAQFFCYLADLPGFGRSFSVRERGLSLLEHANLVRQLIQRVRRPGDRIILVGHDIGGAICQICAMENPDHLSGLVLINCSGVHEPLRGMRAGWFGVAARLRLFRLLRRAAKLPPESLDTLVAPWLKRDSRLSLVRAMRSLEESWPGPHERQHWKRQLFKLALPVLLLWGARDPMNDPEAGLQLVHDMREAYFFSHPGCGHWPILESPEWVIAKIQEYAFQISPNIAGSRVRHAEA